MRSQVRREAGFTLIEMLAVILILGILVTVLIVNMTDTVKVFEAEVTKTTMQTIGLAAAEFEHDQGDYPRSKFATELGTPPNDVNLGGECLYLALCAEKAPGFGRFQDKYSNSDEDQLVKRPTGFQVATLFELGDQWGNPMAYFHRSDYGREDVYVTVDENGERVESPVRAYMDKKTGYYYEALKFQLISAGADGEFGTQDDVTNFTVDG